MGVSAGLILSNLVFLILTAVTTPEQFDSWGWRVPFLFSAVLVLVGFYVRSRVDESPEFTSRLQSSEPVRLPIVSVLRTHWRQVLSSAALFSGLTAMGTSLLSTPSATAQNS